ncbi:MAG TPA: aldehyde dehydrogenase family protein [Vicinamibacterales bacterium]|nr:aldehyde dehydrogenase family protein [Vicinamibacterales bacterium]
MYPRQVLHWIDDAETPSQGAAKFFEKRGPMDDTVIGEVARGTSEDVKRAVDAAAAATDAWGRVPAPRRGEILTAVAGLLRLRAKDREFAEIIQCETGKPWKNAAAEIASAIELAAFMASEGSRLYGKTMTSPTPNRGVRTVRTPVGVCGAVMPFNSPLAGLAWKVFPALVCGNAVVAKSHELTPYTAVAFGKLLQEAGLPRGVYSVVQGYGPEVGLPLVTDDRVGVVSFTGSAATGKLIQKAVSERRVLAKVCLELGGKNPLVVCDDADVTIAVEQAVASAFLDAGQRCASGSRLIVFRHVYDDFRQSLIARTEAVKVGSGDEDDCGPVISRQSLDRLLEAIDGAVQRGARVLTGGCVVERLGQGYYMAPTVLDNVAPEDELSQTELFGPVTCLYRVKDFEEAITLANSTSFGLTGAIHTSNSHRIEEFITRYRGGLVSINGPTYGAGPHMPFGGVKNSGNGFREPGTEALDVYTEWKTVVMNHDPARV